MDLKENWRAWQRSLWAKHVSIDRDLDGEGSWKTGQGHSREITSGFLVFCLLFCQKAGEGDDVGIDVFGAGASGLAI